MAKNLDEYFNEMPVAEKIEDLATQKKKKKKLARSKAMRLLKKRKGEMQDALDKIEF